ncbi:NUC188 domain-containing protein [Gymnopilus junonius]|uniref:NUC188 domain-containing protein n=1 Tax=Gymnopilus junonius TaxID=109634 RepID=A0A9P5NXM7_GYMJU|nr:NUC188 domain-containing protein [Gymnopilus junonius]
MASKRANEEMKYEITGREKKKLKVSAARTIAVQPPASTSKAVVSKSVPSSSLTGLPGALDVEKFVEARAFEIDAMHTAMKTASASSTHRVWQTLPRHLRRRAASHDVRRVPLKLRDRARAEMDPVRKKALGRSMPKHGRDKQVTRTESFMKRQRDKIWLETHLWHAKRMHMESLWGYKLAISPTEKSYRPSHRASVHGSILHDASYYSLVEIISMESILTAMLDLCCDPQGSGPGSKRWSSGSRVLETFIYKVGAYPFDLIAPVTIIWKPRPQAAFGNSSESPSGVASSNKNGKGKEKQGPTNNADIRFVWLRFHPSAQTSVFNALKEAASSALASYRSLHPDATEAAVEIADLSRQVNVFEIMGPKSNQVIKGALSPVLLESREDFLQFWSSLSNLQSSGSIPRGMIIGFKVDDPRLKFPPKNAKPLSNHPPPMNVTLPSAQLANTEIWDEKIRTGLLKPRFQKKDIDERRFKSDVPGTKLSALRQDDRIPVLLIQRSIDSSDSVDNQGVHGWTLIIPAGWSMAFFSSLTYTSTRVAGQQERQTQAYEAGTAYFPRDLPFNEAYEDYAKTREEKEKQTWERKPPAKRINYEKVGTSSPWQADWKTVLGISGEEIQERDEAAFVPAQREHIVEELLKPIRPWLLRGPEVPKIISSMSSVFNHGAALLSELNRLRLKRGYEPLPNTLKPSDLLQGALVNVKITMCSRGAPDDLAMVYSLSDGVAKQWERLLAQRNKGSDLETPEELEVFIVSSILI